MQMSIGNTALTLVQGDITEQDTDAIVNAANPSLLGGGGVDGAIYRAGGPKILEECKAILSRQGECPTGEAVITSAGLLKARYVIHAVGPVWRGGTFHEDDLLQRAYRNSLVLALAHRLFTIAFPSISTGVYGFPIKQASQIAFTTICDVVHSTGQFTEVRLIVFSKNDYAVYRPLFDNG